MPGFFSLLSLAVLGSPAPGQSFSMTLRRSDPVISNLLGLDKCAGQPAHLMCPSMPRCPSCPRSRNPTHHGLRGPGPGSAPPSSQAACGISRAGQKWLHGETKRAVSREHEGDAGVGSGAGLAGSVQVPAAMSCAALREFLHLSETSVSLLGSWRM